jgi:hypothetical protein
MNFVDNRKITFSPQPLQGRRTLRAQRSQRDVGEGMGIHLSKKNYFPMIQSQSAGFFVLSFQGRCPAGVDGSPCGWMCDREMGKTTWI